MVKYLKWLGAALVGLFLIGIVVVVGILYSKTINSLHHPVPERDPITKTPADYGLDYETITVTTVDGLDLAGWYIPTKNGATIIAQHGYKSDRTVMLNIASVLVKHNYGVIMVDLRAHGLSEGDLITLGMEEQRDVDAAYHYLLTRPEVDPERIGAFGNSMGGATVIMYAAQNPGIRAVIAQSSYARAEEIAKKDMEHYTGVSPSPPVYALVRFFAERHTGYSAQDLNIESYIGKISPRPVFILQGGQDEHIPSDSGYRLYNAAGEPRELWYEPEQEHVFFDRDYPAEFETRVIAFFDKHLLEKSE